MESTKKESIPGMKKPDLQVLPRINDRMSFIYLEHAQVSCDDGAVTVRDNEGLIYIPAASITALLLGPGTSITHRAMELIGDMGISLVWVGEHGVRYYAHGRALSSRTRLLEKQAKLASNEKQHIAVARRMYQMRFPDEDVSDLTMQQLRGREGSRVRAIYRKAAKETGVEWHGREYDPDDFAAGSAVNQALSAGWEPIDLDGLHLIRRPFPKEDSTGEDGKKRPEPSQARINLLSRVKPRRCNDLQDYTIIDIETTGLTPADSEILEMAALRVRGGSEAETFSAVVKIEGKFPDTIAKLTGISPDEIEMGQPIDKVLGEFREFLGQDMLVGYNVPFDCSFINAASRKARLPRLANRQLDVMTLAKKILRGLDSYRLEAVAKILNLGGQEHRALADCRLVQVVLDKLNEFRQPSK